MTDSDNAPDSVAFMEEDIPYWIRGGFFDRFCTGFQQYCDQQSVSMINISDFSLRIVNVFNRALKRGAPLSKADMTKWLDVLLLPNKGKYRQILDRLIDRSNPNTGTDRGFADVYELFCIIVKKDPQVLLSETDKGRSLFHEAAQHGCLDIITLCREEILTLFRFESGGHVRVSELIMAKDSEGSSALHLAVASGAAEMAKALLSFCQIEDDNCCMAETLLCAIKFTSYDVVESILRRGAGKNTNLSPQQRDGVHSAQPNDYRIHLIESRMLKAAIDSCQGDILGLLARLRPEILQDKDCTLLHEAVRNDLADVAETLLELAPELATRFQLEEGGQPSTVESDRRMISAYSLAHPSRNGETIKSLILPILMRLLPISAIRFHLNGGNEIYLDLTYLDRQPTYLNEFIESIKQELSLGPKASSLSSPKVMSLPESLDTFSQVAFENALQYVSIPLFTRADKTPRNDATLVLSWLRERKGVKSIAELCVEDGFHDPHREEYIEMALKGLDIQELNWRRLDLSIFAILACSPTIEHLKLYSSGNLGTIDHWRGPNGISTLKKLRRLDIAMVEESVSEDRHRKCQAMFDDYKANNPHQQINISAEPWGTLRKVTTNQSTSAAFSKSTPVSVVKLKHFIKAFTTFQRERISERQRQPSRTRVAILDTGINKALFPGKGHRISGASFYNSYLGRKERESPWWLAADSHGSYVANVISQLDPCCELYIAQVAVHKDNFSLESVAKVRVFCAVHACAASLELTRSYRHSSGRLNRTFKLLIVALCCSGLSKQISIAAQKRIVIMCSTADEGYLRQQVWPAEYHTSSRYENIFPMVACDSMGKLTGYSTKTSARYRLQGEQIDASYPGASLRHEATNSIVSGSSIATAMATGVASLILACEDVACAWEGSSSHGDQVQKVGKGFQEMCRRTTGDHEPALITPSLVFKSGADDFGDNNEFAKWARQFRKRIS